MLFHRLVERTARELPNPEFRDPLLHAAEHVLRLQNCVHGAQLAEIAEGRFRFLGRSMDFGGIDRIAWRVEMGEGNNRLWRMTLSYLGWTVPLLARGAARDVSMIRRAIDSLVAQNQWNVPGVFRDVWHPYSASHRLINLLAGYALFRAAGGRHSDDLAALLEHAKFCAAFVLRNLERDLQFNHLLKNYVALSLYRAALGQNTTRLGFLDRAIRRTLDQVVLSDGGHAERSPMYHALCLVDLRTLQAANSANAPWLEAAISAMQSALGVMCHPDGDIGLFNDSWFGEAPSASELAPPAVDGRVALPETGYVRLSGQNDAVIFDCGPCGPDSNPGHAHADFLSVEVSVAGKRFLVDPGVPTYSQGPARDHCRSACRHNGPHVIDVEPIEFWGSFRVGRRGLALPLEDPTLGSVVPLWAAGYQTGFRPVGADVARWVGLWPGCALLIIDVWRGVEPARARGRFLVPGTWSALPSGAFAAGGVQVSLNVLLGKRHQVVGDKWWPKFGESESAHSISIHPVPDDDGSVAATLWIWKERVPATSLQACGIARTLLAHCRGHLP
ncbi:MAG: heparinase II/III family protein [Bradyrhizobium sp.]|uniref:heparinase II/III family protein n=1 Tax=Bradyrhizobium sp. TaxID=376 RepID=UPI0025B7AFA0|nr:alginate lyase family protein [Bradyrhizobium sp.]MBI5260652.1 heparinase II/III family protein [Bradyrhizobium sp.]